MLFTCFLYVFKRISVFYFFVCFCVVFIYFSVRFQLNLASQSVLESLNSVFDHRGELYVPELDRKFEVDREQMKIFACQNPLQEGGGRKGLPKSFLNRFTQVLFNFFYSQYTSFINSITVQKL